VCLERSQAYVLSQTDTCVFASSDNSNNNNAKILLVCVIRMAFVRPLCCNIPPRLPRDDVNVFRMFMFDDARGEHTSCPIQSNL
jgi:hypothetical protein